MQEFDFIKRGNITFSEYLVVIELFNNGYIMAIKGCPEEAESLARAIATHINTSTKEEEGFDEMIKPYKVLRKYTVNGNAHSISNSIWCDTSAYFEVSVIGINIKEGGLIRFIRERENYSLLLSVNEYYQKIEQINSMFKNYVFCAN